jgi:hypothetical protein
MYIAANGNTLQHREHEKEYKKHIICPFKNIYLLHKKLLNSHVLRGIKYYSTV